MPTAEKSEQMTYVCYSKCGHINALVGVPAIDDHDARASLIEWLEFYIKTGHIEYVGLEALKNCKLELCDCAARTLTAETITDEQITQLFERHCECRPTDVRRKSHSHDCEDDVTDACRVALGGKPTGQLHPRSTAQAILDRAAARALCADFYRNTFINEG